MVEDNPSDIELTRRAFRKNGLADKLVVAESGQEALGYLSDTTQPLPAVVLLDLKLPGVGGLEVLRRIRAGQRTHLLPVVVLTTSKEQQDMVESYRLGANSYIRKPVSFGQFCEAVAQLGAYWLILNEPAPTEIK